MQQVKDFIAWYKYTAQPIGLLVLGVVLFYFFKLASCTVACYSFGIACHASYGANDAMAQYMSDLVGANQGMDIVTAKRKK
jgi:hypothetical protein